MFRKTIMDVYNQIIGNPGNLVLSENNQEIKFSKHVELINDYINIDLNDKNINQVVHLVKR